MRGGRYLRGALVDSEGEAVNALYLYWNKPLEMENLD